ncbi:MAG TPA: MaoC family dehydratase N-terminal domain-containing protein [Spirochaetota bacterium]|jgi:hypothetical protein|nr:MAG: hypothetical protein BWX91_02342 [Spirochaetes bacterium ADurb.Bin133]HNZ28060.1 MaoC family dehydratase N-terminal domain-containing protein [Spirochaetota bacterium]HPY88685.1 MaoC family dehydratase N-terminal domain-containing protein [Spirochaetota bacterium]
MLDFSYEGKVFDSFTYKVERCKIKELAQAIGDDNPLFYDKDYAVSQGYKDTPAPLTFPTVINFWGYPEIWKRMSEIGIDVKRLLHAKEEYQYIEPIYPGDVLTGTVKVDSMRSGGLMDMVTFKSTFIREGKEALTAKMTIVVVAQGE